MVLIHRHATEKFGYSISFCATNPFSMLRSLASDVSCVRSSSSSSRPLRGRLGVFLSCTPRAAKSLLSRLVGKSKCLHSSHSRAGRHQGTSVEHLRGLKAVFLAVPKKAARSTYLVIVEEGGRAAGRRAGRQDRLPSGPLVK